MLDIALFWLPYVLLIVSCVISVLVLLRSRKHRQDIETKMQAMELLLKNNRKQHDNLMNQFNELRTGAMGMSRKLADLSDQFDSLVEKQNEIEMLDPDGRLYSRATKMVDLGADIEELMEECDLPKAEAELLMNIRRQQRASR
ncbi:DUF2802 domain-containing protein [Veronia pacifica]|uniref:DNA repair protein n=1 Tax=Veronia pacifica TaxID=1080227 RepID=A0A1C3EEG2_9GAMM|nr:DUF2802 domain-containing protein [Veronia pacifica]ODA31626.1 DNA repair protein [Veronia pacifica]